MQQKTTVAHKSHVEQSWYVTSAEGQILGRFATRIAMVLMGKHQPGYTPHVDTGDFVVVTNCEKIQLTGKKAETRQYDYYTYHTGGHKYVSHAKMMDKRPEQIIIEAVRRMLPKSKLGRKMLSKLKVYRGSDHPHAAQMPQELELSRV
jgi:large subunit ribosomal protein L13